MSEFVTVADVAEIPLGEARSIPIRGRLIGVFHTADGFFAIDDACPHMGASLAGGYVEGDAVMCPWHAWRFCVRDGTWLDNPKSPLKAASYEVRVADGEVQVKIPAEESPDQHSP